MGTNTLLSNAQLFRPQSKPNSKTGLKVETQRYTNSTEPGEQTLVRRYFAPNGDSYCTAITKGYDPERKGLIDKLIVVSNKGQEVAKTEGLVPIRKTGTPSLIEMAANVVARHPQELTEEGFKALPRQIQRPLMENAGFQNRFPEQLTNNKTRFDFLTKSPDLQKAQLEALVNSSKPESAAELLKIKFIFKKALARL